MPFADADRAKDYQRQYRREQRVAAGCTSARTTLPIEHRLQTPERKDRKRNQKLTESLGAAFARASAVSEGALLHILQYPSVNGLKLAGGASKLFIQMLENGWQALPDAFR